MLTNSTYPFKIVSIIFNNETIHNVTTDSTTPMFSVSPALYDALIKYDISNHSDNWTINLLCKVYYLLSRFKDESHVPDWSHILPKHNSLNSNVYFYSHLAFSLLAH